MSSMTPLDTRQTDKWLRMLLALFTFIDPVFGAITAPAGFVTNFASLQALHNIILFPLYALVSGYGNRAATIHDWLYSGNPITRADGSLYYPTRAECDAVLYRALLAEGVAHWRAYLFWAGVRLGGASHYTTPVNPGSSASGAQ